MNKRTAVNPEKFVSIKPVPQKSLLFPIYCSACGKKIACWAMPLGWTLVSPDQLSPFFCPTCMDKAFRLVGKQAIYELRQDFVPAKPSDCEERTRAILDSNADDSEKIRQLHELGYANAQLHKQFGFSKRLIQEEMEHNSNARSS
ncbi:MAG: hypothetical protein U9R04_01210 [Chloroflexota bacterium]|nr:hypothetical protein [Chloroflexota bacterium]